jgi:hypothetical protein
MKKEKKDDEKPFSGFSDKQILDTLEKPEDFEVDDYEILVNLAFKKRLISEEMRNEYLYAIKDAQEEEAEELRIGIESYWQCPKCGTAVDNQLDCCWKCLTYKPRKTIHPTKENIEKQIDSEPAKPIKSGLILIALGIFLIVMTYTSIWTSPNLEYIYYGRYFFAVVFIIIGFFIIGAGTSNKKN